VTIVQRVGKRRCDSVVENGRQMQGPRSPNEGGDARVIL
jgi:hypothetical protein